MSFADKTLQCADCGADFVFTAEEQEFFASKGYTNEPKTVSHLPSEPQVTEDLTAATDSRVGSSTAPYVLSAARTVKSPSSLAMVDRCTAATASDDFEAGSSRHR